MLQEELEDGSISLHCSKDLVVNSYGQLLLDLCVSLKVRIVNGRRGKDERVGEYTCFTDRGQNVMDYLTVSTALFNDAKDVFVVP